MTNFTTFSTGTILASEVNDNFTTTRLNRAEVYYHPTVNITPGPTNWVDGTGVELTLTDTNNAVLNSVYLEGTFSGLIQVNIQFSGTTLGNVYMVQNTFDKQTFDAATHVTTTPAISYTESHMMERNTDNTASYAANCIYPLLLTDDETTVKMRIKAAGPPDDIGYLDVKMIVTYFTHYVSV